MLAAAAMVLGAAPEPPPRRSKIDEENPSLPDNPDPRVEYPDPKAGAEELRKKREAVRARKAKYAPVLRTDLRCGDMTEEQIRASAEQAKACKPRPPCRSRASKRKRGGK